MQASEGKVVVETTEVIKPGDEDEWVHSYRDGTKWKHWEGEPFMTEGRVDLPTLLRANEPGQYPRRTASTSSRRSLTVGEDIGHRAVEWELGTGGLARAERYRTDVCQDAGYGQEAWGSRRGTMGTTRYG